MAVGVRGAFAGGMLSLLAVACSTGLNNPSVEANVERDASRAPTELSVGTSSIGGVVRSELGPEAGVWVIAETEELGNKLVKVVVTDDEGRYVLPDLPDATYNVWVRGYGLTDSEQHAAHPGELINFNVQVAATGHEAASIYPANYWLSLIDLPDESEFPGTGPEGNGIAPANETRDHWVANLVENCQFCHQLGTARVRNLPDGVDHVEAWKYRISMMGRSPDNAFFEDDPAYQKRDYTVRMKDNMTLFGEERGYRMFADWTQKIASGALPETPKRPEGIERNLVITMWDMADGRFMHDSNSSDKRNPTVNANGPVYGYAQFSGMVYALDPKTGEETTYKLTNLRGEYFKHGNNHTGTLDQHGRMWMTSTVNLSPRTVRKSEGDNPEFCTSPTNKFASYLPRPADETRLAMVLDPTTGETEVVQTCFGTHHLNFDSQDRLYLSGDTEVVGWIDMPVWDETKDASQAVGWCPFVLDTNGDGRIDPDSSNWNERLSGLFGGEGGMFRDESEVAEEPLDPTKDTRIAGFNYGIGVSPKDGTYWAAKYSPLVPSGVLRVDPGANPPLTCKTEYYEPPMVDGRHLAFNARGVDVDNDGVAWVGFGSGAIGKFDRSKCSVLNGPTATGQHCPEGWEIIETPGPKIADTDVGSDWFYLSFVDNHDVSGLGKGIPLFPNSSGDEILAYLPDQEDFVRLRVPYPLGFYTRGLDGRIDDPDGGWKGRGIWATSNSTAPWHQEGGEGSKLYAAKFQFRPSPLAE